MSVSEGNGKPRHVKVPQFYVLPDFNRHVLLDLLNIQADCIQLATEGHGIEGNGKPRMVRVIRCTGPRSPLSFIF